MKLYKLKKNDISIGELLCYEVENAINDHRKAMVIGDELTFTIKRVG